ncbi:MAG: DUF192 domain-containing protein [Pseudomonadota bacterium]
MTSNLQKPHPQANRHAPDLLRRAAIVLAAAAALLGSVAAPAQMGPLEDLAAFPRGKLEIADGRKTRHTFEVWLADTPSRQAQGLMFVRALPSLHGMLFVHESLKPMSMWMKNTYIPLDMVFIDAHGRIQQIVARTVPHSLDIISSTDPALAVLEIGGGEAKRLGLHPGQRVIHPALARH